jgi:hypothetical protein
MWHRSWYFLQEITWELVCITFWNKNFGMQKVTPPAPSYYAASDIDQN